MANVVVRDWQGKESGKASLDLKVARETSAGDLLHRAVVRQLAHARQGTASTLTRAEVAGGGIVFGPKPRSYELAMNRKERRLALRTALMSRVDDIVVVKGFGQGLDAPKTREITAALGRLGIEAGSKVLVILDNASEAVRLSIRNLEKVKLIAADQLNVFDLLHHSTLLVSEEALAKIQEVYGDG